MGLFDRNFKSKALTIANGTALSDPVEMSGFAGGAVMLPATWTAANVGFKVCDTKDGTFVPLYDATGAVVEITNVATAVAQAYALPAEVYGAHWVKLWSKNTGSTADVNQGADRAITLLLKA